jgi:hypothetical protein
MNNLFVTTVHEEDNVAGYRTVMLVLNYESKDGPVSLPVYFVTIQISEPHLCIQPCSYLLSRV